MEKLEKSKNTSLRDTDKLKTKQGVKKDPGRKSPGRKSPTKGILKQPVKTDKQKPIAKVDNTLNQSSQTFVSNNVFVRSPSKDSYTQANIPFTTSDLKPKQTITTTASVPLQNTSTDSENRFFHVTNTPNLPNQNRSGTILTNENNPQAGQKTVQDYETLNNLLILKLCSAVDIVDSMLSVAKNPPQKMKSLKNLKALRYLIRENEQLQDQLHVPLPTEQHSTQDDKMNQVRQPYYNQVLLKRIETLEADREVLRQLNRSLTLENEEIKTNRHGIEMREDSQLGLASPFRNLNATYPKTEEPRVHREISNLKNQITTLNEDLMEYKKLSSLTSEMLNSSFSRPRPDVAASSPTANPSHPAFHRNGFVPYHQWENLCEQSKLVLEENQLLVDQKSLYKKTINDLTENYQNEVSKLHVQLNNTVKEKKALARELSEMESEMFHLRSRCTTMNERVESSVEKSEHERRIERINKDHLNEIDDLKREVKRITASLEAVNNEKSRLAIQVTDLTAVNSRLTMEVRIAEKNARRADRHLYKCMAELQNVCNKEITAKGTLVEVLKLAEKTAYEREQMAAMVESQKEKTQFALQQIHKDDMTLQELRKELKNTKERRKSQFSKIKQHILDQEEEVSGIIGNYQDELKGLKHVIREKQNFIDQMRSDKQLTESRLDEMWRTLHPPYPVIKGYEGRS